MAKPRVVVHSSAIRKMLSSAGVKSDLRARAEKVASAAQASAPVETGEYRDSIHVQDASSGTRARMRVVSNAEHALVVEANTGNLAKALDSA